MKLDPTDVTFYQGESIRVNVSLIDRIGGPIPDAEISFEEENGLVIALTNGSISIASETPGHYSIDVEGLYRGSAFEGSINVSVLESSVLTEVILDPVKDRTYDILAYDQNGELMSDLCEIEIIGDHRYIDNDTFEAISGHIEVKVTYNGTTISKILDAGIKEESERFPIAAVGASVLSLIAISIVLLFFVRKRSEKKNEE